MKFILSHIWVFTLISFSALFGYLYGLNKDSSRLLTFIGVYGISLMIWDMIDKKEVKK